MFIMKKKLKIVFNLFLLHNYQFKLIYCFRLEASLADSLEILRITKATEQRHRKNSVLNNPCVIYKNSIYGLIRTVYLQVGSFAFYFWKKLTVGKNHLINKMNEMKIHSLDTVPYRSVTPTAFKWSHASFIFIYNILNVLHIFLFKKITSLSKIHGNSIIKCLWTDTNDSWQYFSQQKRIFLFT